MKKFYCLLAFLTICLYQQLLAQDNLSKNTIVVGSSWWFIDDDEDYETREQPYIIKFSENSILNLYLVKDTSPDNDSWEQIENLIIFYYNDKYVKHEGIIINKNYIEGTATNVDNISWKFRLVRID